MKLKAYRKQQDLSQEAFGKLIGDGVTKVTVSAWENGTKYPTPEHARLIVATTNGAVGFEDLYGEPETDEEAAQAA